MFRSLRLDYTILTILFLFWGISTVLIYSATSGTRFDGMHIQHFYMFGIMFVLTVALSLINCRLLVYPFVYVLYGFGIVLLVLVLLIGKDINGAKSWLDLGIQFQPAELAKFLLVLTVSRYMAAREGAPLELVRDVIPILLLTALPVVLIAVQPDLGSSIVFLAIVSGLLWIGNIQKKHVLLLVGIVVALVGSLVALYFLNNHLFFKVIQEHQMERIEAFLDPETDPDKLYHVSNAKAAISVGQLAGYGLNRGPYVQNNLVPYTYSDSIYVVVGEEFGFIGSAVLLLLFFVLIYRMIQIALECRDLFSKYFTVGVATILSFQVFVNIGMHLGLLPLTGLTLPFISYGGSSLLLNMLSVGMVLSIRNHDPAAK